MAGPEVPACETKHRGFWTRVMCAGVRWGLRLFLIVFLCVVAFFGFIFLYVPRVSVPTVLSVVLSGTLRESKDDALPFLMFQDRSTLSFPQLLFSLNRAMQDKNIRAVVVFFQDASMGVAQAEELHDAFVRLRNAGKPVYVHALSFGVFSGGTPAYFAASGATKVFLFPLGRLAFTGLSMESFFFRSALDRWGIVPRFFQVGKFKGTGDMFLQKKTSPEQRKEIFSLLSSLEHRIVKAVAMARRRPEKDIQEALRSGPFDGTEAERRGLVDGVLPPREFDAFIQRALHKEAPSLTIEDYFALGKRAKWAQQTRDSLLFRARKEIVFLSIRGEIVSSSSIAPHVSAVELFNTLRALAANPSVRAVVIRVTSPGGEASAAELVRQGILELREAGKPVVVSLGEVAASGGLWLSLGADRIVCAAGTITGSIGVFGGKFVLSKFLESFDISKEGIALEENAFLESPFAPLSSDGEKKIIAHLEDTYKTFLSLVSVTRKLSPQAVSALAEGRMWTGEQAFARHLVDALGGLMRAMSLARELSHVGEDTPIREIEVSSSSIISMFLEWLWSKM